jgi:hypothetical protein
MRDVKADRHIVHTVYADDGSLEIYWARDCEDFPEAVPESFNSVRLHKGGALTWIGWTDTDKPIPVSVTILSNRVVVATSELEYIIEGKEVVFDSLNLSKPTETIETNDPRSSLDVRTNVSPYQPGDLVTVSFIDTEGLQKRYLHPPIIFKVGDAAVPRHTSPLNGEQAVIIKPTYVTGGRSNVTHELDERSYVLDAGYEVHVSDDLLNPTWIYLATICTGNFKGESFELADYELIDA